MSALNWLFGSRRRQVAAEPMDGALVLDRLEARLGVPLRGDARIIIAGQLEVAVERILTSQSLSTAAMMAQREGARIAAMLPRPFAVTLQPIIADELVRGRSAAGVQPS